MNTMCLVGYTSFLHADIVWNRATDFEKYVVAFYWAVTTITSVGYVVAIHIGMVFDIKYYHRAIHYNSYYTVCHLHVYGLSVASALVMTARTTQ